MRIGILRIKKHNFEWFNTLFSGVVSSGNKPLEIKENIIDIDVLIVVGLYYEPYEYCNSVRAYIEKKVPIIFVDSGIHWSQYVLTINHPKRFGIDYTDELKYSDSRRALFLSPLKFSYEWKYASNKQVLILPHCAVGIAKQTEQELINQINLAKQQLEGNGFDVIVLHHPRTTKTIPMNTGNKLEHLIKTSRFCVSWHSNALCHSIISGVPGICLDSRSLAYDVSSHDLNEIIYPDRDEWINKMSWCHWNKQEIKNGTAFKTLLEYINDSTI